MRTVSATRRVGDPPASVLDTLDPMTIIDAEGTFSALDIEETGDETRVFARGGGMEVVFTFNKTDDGYEYEQLGDAGPFETMETTLVVTPADEGSLLTMDSTVSLGLPFASVTDRIAAWKRRGELKRALRAIDEEV
ncbi:START superfamily protein [Halanaeroarchaeum sp. HSR-CO]|uniref:SRPBCC family protein n=1 Tax=Halanaeroarchaeum sp. HSR-CO TaxID=2866382 RepID=UPI00217E58AD|nr:SRPBCC family protein [Halanaeroarchaeum sp. HSR-CO]UWG46475.1 START superfamily protein [Halanaeroarchaeum sp. HSR-CO]